MRSFIGLERLQGSCSLIFRGRFLLRCPYFWMHTVSRNVIMCFKTECTAQGTEVIKVPILNPDLPIGIDKVRTGKCPVRLFLSLGHPVLHSEYSEIQACSNQF